MDYQDCGLHGLTFNQPSLVKTQFAYDCDISNIVRRFIRTGELPAMRQRPNIGSDETYPSDFQALQDDIAAAKSRFESLPEEERAKFGDVETWLASMSEEKPEEKPDEKSDEKPDEKPEEKPGEKSA